MRSSSLVALVALFAVALAGCPLPLKDCGGACYLDNMYCCVDGNLITKSLCGDNGGHGGDHGGDHGNNNNCAYRRGDNWSGWNFYDQFNFFTAGDPTHGYVQFVDRDEAQSTGLISVNEHGQTYMGVDHSNNGGNGRKAVRLESKEQYGEGLYILDLAHMPGSICGTWPAFWTVGDNWPHGGEIDIIEGVNREETNAMTLHTNAGCFMNGQWQSGRTMQGNCDVVPTGNAGCGVQANKANTYGDNFNRNGGGVYAMERTSGSIRVWFFPRNGIPGDVLSDSPNPCNWGQPDADFPLGDNCPNNHFGNHRIVFDITFCGDWAGAVFGQQCPGMGDCVNYVRNNPGDFAESYWLINSLKYLRR